MRLTIALGLSVLLGSPAFAQNQQLSPSQAALQIQSLITQLAQGLESCVAGGQKLQSQIDELKKELDEAKKAPVPVKP